jgi:hypothetical protein
MSKTHFTDDPIGVRFNASWERGLLGNSICGFCFPPKLTTDPNLVDCQFCDEILIKRALARVMKEDLSDTYVQR